MSGIATCLAALLLGIDIGYQPSPQGGAEYIIQIEPGTLQALNPGEEMESCIPAEARDIHPRRIRVVIGNQKLPKEIPVKAAGGGVAGREGPAALTPAGRTAPAGPAFDLLHGVPGSKAGQISPAPFPPDPNAKPAVYLEPSGGGSKAEPQPAAAGPTATHEAEKPWLPFWGLLLGLGASLAGNVYLGWVFWDARRSYERSAIRN
jgi:hypothetical protein